MAKTGSKKLVEGTVRPSWFVPVVALLLLGAAAGAFLGYSGLTKSPPNTTTGWAGIASAVAAVVLVALLVLVTRCEVRVDLKGIRWRKGLGKPVSIRWSEPHDFFYRAFTGSSTPSVVKARLRTPDGRCIDVDDLQMPDHPTAKLPALVEHHSTAANLPKIKARLEQGEEVQFGAVRLTADEIQVGEVSRSLEKGVVLQLERSRVRLGAEGKWDATDVPVQEVANYPCLLRAIGQISQALPPS